MTGTPGQPGATTYPELAAKLHPVAKAHQYLGSYRLLNLVGTGRHCEVWDAMHDALAERLAEHPEGKLFDRLLRESAFKRVTFLQPDTPRPEVEQHFADLIFRFRALPNLTRELAEHADHLAEVSEDEFERFAQLRLQVAGIGQHHEADDAGDRDAAKRFQETVARLKREHADAHRRRRPEKHD